MLRRVTVFRGKRDTDVEHEQEKSNRESDVMHFLCASSLAGRGKV